MGPAEHTWASAGVAALLTGCGVCGGWAAYARWCWITNPSHNPTRYRATVYRCHTHLPVAAQGEPDHGQATLQDRERPTDPTSGPGGA